MLMNKLQNIINNYFVQLIILTIIWLMISFTLLETPLGEVNFIYNNF